jgi:hypothetical protein
MRIACVLLASSACWSSSQQSPRPPTPSAAAPARDPIDAACARILAANQRKDAAARAEFVEAQLRGEIHASWGMGEPWSGACARTRGAAWAVRIDEVAYGGVHDATFTIVHVGRTGVETAAPASVRFNYVAFELRDASDDAVTVEYESEGPEHDTTVTARYLWDGYVHAEDEQIE